jgi:hypothetical protein
LALLLFSLLPLFVAFNCCRINQRLKLLLVEALICPY